MSMNKKRFILIVLVFLLIVLIFFYNKHIQYTRERKALTKILKIYERILELLKQKTDPLSTIKYEELQKVYENQNSSSDYKCKKDEFEQLQSFLKDYNDLNAIEQKQLYNLENLKRIFLNNVKTSFECLLLYYDYKILNETDKNRQVTDILSEIELIHIKYPKFHFYTKLPDVKKTTEQIEDIISLLNEKIHLLKRRKELLSGLLRSYYLSYLSNRSSYLDKDDLEKVKKIDTELDNINKKLEEKQLEITKFIAVFRLTFSNNQTK